MTAEELIARPQWTLAHWRESIEDNECWYVYGFGQAYYFDTKSEAIKDFPQFA